MSALLLFFIMFTLVSLILLYKNYKKNKIRFGENQKKIEETISSENERLKKQKQQLEIMDDYKIQYKTSNQELISKIANMNHSLFEEVHSKKD